MIRFFVETNIVLLSLNAPIKQEWDLPFGFQQQTRVSFISIGKVH
jgi:hypothetical protein